MARRYYSNTAVATVLSSGIGAADTSATVDSTTGWPTSTPFNLVIDRGLSTEEVVQCTSKAGTTLTITRGHDGTTGVAHSSDATVELAAIAEDFDDIHTHIHDGTKGAALIAEGMKTLSAATVTATTDTVLTSQSLTIPAAFTGYSVHMIVTGTADLLLKNAANGDLYLTAKWDGTGHTGAPWNIDADANIGYATGETIKVAFAFQALFSNLTGTGAKTFALWAYHDASTPNPVLRDIAVYARALRTS